MTADTTDTTNQNEVPEPKINHDIEKMFYEEIKLKDKDKVYNTKLQDLIERLNRLVYDYLSITPHYVDKHEILVDRNTFIYIIFYNYKTNQYLVFVVQGEISPSQICNTYITVSIQLFIAYDSIVNFIKETIVKEIELFWKNIPTMDQFINKSGKTIEITYNNVVELSIEGDNDSIIKIRGTGVSVEDAYVQTYVMMKKRLLGQ